jgi:hypothetical protein
MNEIFKKLDILGSKMIVITRNRAIRENTKQPFEEQLSIDFCEAESQLKVFY